jgi:hypothetical protein
MTGDGEKPHAGRPADRDQWLRRTLQSALPPVSAAEPRSDLWPRLLERIGRQASGAEAVRLPGVAWFDWALLGLAGGLVVLVPAILPALLYHL